MLVYRLTEEDYPASLFRVTLVPLVRFLFGSLFILLGFMVFIYPDNLFSLAFSHFWLLLMLWIFEEITVQVKPLQRRWFFWTLLISWTSSISLGDNSPVFTIGLLSSSGIGYILFQFAERGFSFRKLNQLQSITGVLVLTLLVLSIPVQKKVNYRDVSSGEQSEPLGAIFPELGKIRTNPATYSYMKEIDRLYHELGFPHGRFAVLPNAAIIYPVIGTPNPLPLDWMQGAEFVGSEDYLLELFNKGVEGKEVYFLIDKFDSKRIADTLIKAEFPLERYPYMPSLIDVSRDLPVESKWFNVRLIK